MFNSPFSYFSPSSRQSVYPVRSRGSQRNGYFYQEPNFWEYDSQAAAEQEYRERLAQLQYQEQRRKAYLHKQQQLEEQYYIQQQQEQEMLEEQERQKHLKAKKEKRRQRKERQLKRSQSVKTEKPEVKSNDIVTQSNLPNKDSEPQSDNDTFFDALTDNINASETEPESEAVPTSPSYTLRTVPDSASNSSFNSSGSESESESDLSTYTSTLKSLETQINANVDVYNRITSALSRDTGAPQATILNSRLKVVQRSQIELEKLYEKLDDLAAAPTAADKLLKQKLTKTAVAYADKTEILFKNLKKLFVDAKEEESFKRKVTVESVPDEDLSC